MKLLFTIILFALGMNCFSQATITMVVNTSQNTGDILAWNIKKVSTGQIMYEHIHPLPASMAILLLDLDAGDYIFTITNSNCNSFVGGCYSLTTPTDVISYYNSTFGCMAQSYFSIEENIPCNDPCRFDYDGDGVVGVSDLVIFIGAYSTICK
jgi:hypothetical protein